MKKRLFLIGSVLTLSGFAQDSALANLKSRLPEIFSACAAHYKALDAAVTPLMKNAKGQTMVPHGYKRGKKMYDMRRIEWWTSGHFPGSLWYLYEATGDGFFKERASVWTENLKPISTYKGNHDIGFMMYCSFGNARRLLKTEKYDHLLVEAANTLCLRFEPELGLIRSWGKTDDKKDFLVIPDNMMNLELLEWAAKAKNGEKRFAEVARSHADVTMKNHFRTDGGTYHVLNYSQKDLRVQEIRRGQGASCFTAWSRGQSWAIYGYTMMYRESGDKAYLDFAQKVADFAINHPNMPEDGIPYWDYGAPGEERDSSAGAIMASGLLELSKFVDAKKGAIYRDFAVKQLVSLASPAYFSEGDEVGHFLLKHGVGHKPGNSEIDTPLNYGDYYFLEALVRVRDM
ncbi:MAG: glycoside hydrolase family 88 protein [Kiritimatiellae bacterium]|nr:glycoside hydrolase family 88 protein [Kiritimatiellia bacterium]